MTREKNADGEIEKQCFGKTQRPPFRVPRLLLLSSFQKKSEKTDCFRLKKAFGRLSFEYLFFAGKKRGRNGSSFFARTSKDPGRGDEKRKENAGNMLMLNKPDIEEMCRDEIRDFVLELVERELQNLPSDARCRRKDLCEAILAGNRATGERAKLRKAACDTVKNWKAQGEQVEALERLGFSVIKGRKHYKVRWRDSGCQKTLSASPSDSRTGMNSVAEMISLFF